MVVEISPSPRLHTRGSHHLRVRKLNPQGGYVPYAICPMILVPMIRSSVGGSNWVQYCSWWLILPGQPDRPAVGCSAIAVMDTLIINSALS